MRRERFRLRASALFNYKQELWRSERDKEGILDALLEIFLAGIALTPNCEQGGELLRGNRTAKGPGRETLKHLPGIGRRVAFEFRRNKNLPVSPGRPGLVEGTLKFYRAQEQPWDLAVA